MTFDPYARRLRRARSTFDRILVVLESIPSTNDLGKRLAREHLRDGRSVPPCDLIAWSQPAGRGRGQKVWSSPAGAGVWVTQVRQASSLDGLQLAPLAVGIGIVRGLGDSLGGRCRLAWPNDVVVDGRKLAGILVESVTVGERSALVIGFGVNHAAGLARFDAPGPTSVLAETPDRMLDLADLTLTLVDAVDTARALDRAAILTAYRSLSAHGPGDRLTCHTGSGVVTGTFAGFDDHGFLRLKTERGEEVVAAAEVESHDP